MLSEIRRIWDAYLQPDTRDETHKLYATPGEVAVIEQELQKMIWGNLYGSLTDKFGVRWMLNCHEK
ncbi:MAG: hypothetical protein WBI53_13190 [Paludibacter sp.]